MITPAVETKPLDTRPAGVLGSPTVIADPNAPTFDPNRLRPAGPTETADSYEEEWYKCQEGESFSKISQTFYYTEKYEQSLRLYNLDRVGTDNLRQERPILRAGQTIRIPPARVLERKYSASVPGMKSGVAGMSGSSGGAPLATLGPVVPDRSDGGISPIEYEVTKPGMTLKDIAKEMLGSSDQWNRIFQLNRWLNSSEPVPVGAKIYVPRPTSR